MAKRDSKKRMNNWGVEEGNCNTCDGTMASGVGITNQTTILGKGNYKTLVKYDWLGKSPPRKYSN
jgi:hypothetical protein